MVVVEILRKGQLRSNRRRTCLSSAARASSNIVERNGDTIVTLSRKAVPPPVCVDCRGQSMGGDSLRVERFKLLLMRRRSS